MTQTAYLVLQLDMNARPARGDGVLKPVNCDGHYFKKDDAIYVARALAVKNPRLRTYVVSVCEQVTP